MRCNPGCCACRRMGWARAEPLLMCVSAGEKAFKPKKLEDRFWGRTLLLETKSPGLCVART